MLDFTTLWAFLQQHKHRLGQVIIALLIFAAGWRTGIVMSPYYAAHPIVFEDRSCDNCASSGGSQEELTPLQKESRGEQDKSAAGPAHRSFSEGGETPGVFTLTPGVKEAPAVAGTSQKQFVGSVNSNLYHHPDCSSAKRIKDQNQIWFTSTEEAEAAGYSPSKCTRQKLGL